MNPGIRALRLASIVLRRRFDLFGMVFALNLFWASLTPSLMPRAWYWQGLISGVLVSIGYGLGLLIRQVIRGVESVFSAFTRARPRPGSSRRRVRRVGPSVRRFLGVWALVATVLVNLVWLSVNVAWQQSVYPLSGFEEPTSSLVRIIIEATLMVVMTLALAWALVSVVRFLAGLMLELRSFLLRRRAIGRLPPVLAQIVALVVALFVVALVFDTGVRPVALQAIDGFYTAHNDREADGVAQPEDPLRSGSPDSLVSWDSLGWPGKTFVSGGPSADELSEYANGAPVKDPIRVYVGKKFSDNIAEQSRIAVKELERTGAFDRSAILVVVVTGTGWVDTKAVRPLEYLYGGDIATVTVQYSYLPSAWSLMLDRGRVQEAAGDLLAGVRGAVQSHAEDTGRSPSLFVFGESLGAYGLERGFGGAAALTEGTDGILLSGTPGFSPVHAVLTAARRETDPCVTADGLNVAFVQDAADMSACPDPVRIMYQQNVSDPVVKWEPSLIWARPEWIDREKRSGELTPYFTWVPGVTWLQMSLDMLISGWAPENYGHNYGASSVRAWLGLTGMQWDDASIERLQSQVQ